MAPGLPALTDECFFITPIGKDGSPERKRSDGVLEFIVSRAASAVGLSAVRADQIAEPGQITLQVIEHVLGARAAVADLTGLNANVFYELAIRHTARLPVVLIAEKDCTLPFDIAQMRTIFFDHTDLASADQCRREIEAHLEEALNNGAVDSPIATTIDVSTMQSGSIVERNVAELVTTAEELLKGQRGLEMRLEHLDRMRERRVTPLAARDLIMGLSDLETLASESSNAELDSVVEQLRRPIQYIARRNDLEDSRGLRSVRRARVEPDEGDDDAPGT